MLPFLRLMIVTYTFVFTTAIYANTDADEDEVSEDSVITVVPPNEYLPSTMFCGYGGFAGSKHTNPNYLKSVSSEERKISNYYGERNKQVEIFFITLENWPEADSRYVLDLLKELMKTYEYDKQDPQKYAEFARPQTTLINKRVILTEFFTSLSYYPEFTQTKESLKKYERAQSISNDEEVETQIESYIDSFAEVYRRNSTCKSEPKNFDMFLKLYFKYLGFKFECSNCANNPK